MALPNLLTLISDKMDYLTQRQAIIAQNVAQANTPNYKPKDLVSFEQVLRNTGATSGAAGSTGFKLAVTDPRHIGTNGSIGGSGPYKSQKTKEVYEVKPSGNAVVLEQQMSQLSDTTAQYQMMTGLYRKAMGLLKTALGRAGG